VIGINHHDENQPRSQRASILAFAGCFDKNEIDWQLRFDATHGYSLEKHILERAIQAQNAREWFLTIGKPIVGALALRACTKNENATLKHA